MTIKKRQVDEQEEYYRTKYWIAKFFFEDGRNRRISDQKRNVIELIGNINSSDLILDIGCGSGKYSALFLELPQSTQLTYPMKP